LGEVRVAGNIVRQPTLSMALIPVDPEEH
jgi:hypothetical protein